MYKKILVPLDGSDLAECVLPHVESITKGCGTESVVFVRAVDAEMSSSAYAYIGESMRKEIAESNEKTAGEYLDQIVSRVKLDGVKAQKQIITGKAAESIAEYATKNSADLIAIATHGRSGISRWAWGSVADRILRSACVPVLMVRAPGCVPGI